MNNPNYGYQPPMPPQAPKAPANAMAIASLVCGILAIILCWFYMVNIAALILAIVGVVCGAMGMKQAKLTGSGNGMAVAGLVISIVGLVFAFIGFLTCTVCVCMASNELEEAANALNGGFYY